MEPSRLLNFTTVTSHSYWRHSVIDLVHLEFGDTAAAILTSSAAFAVCVTITADAGNAAAYPTFDRPLGFHIHYGSLRSDLMGRRIL